MADFRLYPYVGEDIASFVDRCPPSTTTDCSWIQVHSEDRKDENNGNITDYVQVGRTILDDIARRMSDPSRNETKAAIGRASARRLLALAKLHGVTCGKWLLFVPTDDVDDVWRVIAATNFYSSDLGMYIADLHALPCFLLPLSIVSLCCAMICCAVLCLACRCAIAPESLWNH
jgi:hypothetical protein